MKKLSVKLAGAFVAVAFAVTASSASALTTQELIDLLVGAGLLTADQVSAVVGTTAGGSTTGSSAACGPFTRDLTMGSTGSDVTTLQNFLMGAGQTIPAGATGYFGTQTQMALKGWQAANGVSPAAGYFGPVTKAKVATFCSPTTPTTPTTPGTSTGSLQGGAGSVDSYELVSKYNNEEVGEDEEDVVVLGIDIENSDNSDIELMAVKVDFAQGTATNDDFDEFATEVSIWFDGEKVGEADADEFDEDNGYVKTISLDQGVVIESDETEELLVAVSGVNNLDTNDKDKTWTVDVTQIRYMDAQGSVISEDPSTSTRTLSFTTFASSADVELKIKNGDDDINEAHVIDVDASDETEDVPVLSLEVEVEGDSDLLVDEVVVEFTVTGAGHLDEMASAVYLFVDGDQVGSENVPTDEETVTFDDLDLELSAGDTFDFEVRVDLLAVSGALDEGDTIAAKVTSTERALWDVEDETGEELASGDKTGAVTGEAHVVYDNGIMVEFVESSYVKTSSDTSGVNETVEFELVFDITAFGEDIWVEQTCVDGSTGTDVDAVEVFLTGDTNGDNTTCTNLDSTGDSGTHGFEVNEGSTERFTATILGNAGEAGGAGSSVTFQAFLKGIGYNVSTDGVGDTVYSTNLEDFKSKAVTVFDR